jgi:hypothetical protein
MAKVIITDEQMIAGSWHAWLKVLGIGAVTGILFWFLTLLIGRYIVDPLVCGQAVDVARCAESLSMSSGIAMILAAVVSVVVMVRASVARPIIVAIASAAVLWGLALWTEGLFWFEALAWFAALYIATFALFGWITRYAKLWVTIILSALIVVIIRFALVA